MGTPPRKELPPPVEGFGADASRLAAATAAYGEELSRALSDDADVLELLDDEPTRPHAIVREPSGSQRASLEPVSEDAHPADQVRVATQPKLLSEALAAVAAGPLPETKLEPGPTSEPPSGLSPGPAPQLQPQAPVGGGPRAPLQVAEPRILAPNRSPSPVHVRVGLLSADRVTNLLAGAAIGLALTIIPAHKLARAHGRALLTQPLLELAESIDHPLGVDAGLMRKPQAIAAEIEAAREATRTRYLTIWLLVGLPLGLGLGLVPRWWA